MIQLRRHRPDDVDAIYEAVRESIDELSKWMPWCYSGYSREDVAGWVATRDQAWENNQEWDFVIIDDDGRPLGCCGIHHIDEVNHTANLGYWVRSTAQNQGVATMVVGQLREFAFEERELHRLEILIAVENTASQRVAEKADATREAVLRERLLLRGRHHDAVLFAIVRNAPNSLPSRRR